MSKYIKNLTVNQSICIKEIGFDDECNKIHYIGTDKTKDKFNLRNTSITNNQLKQANLDKNYVTAPTFEQTFTYFREEFDLYYTPYQIIDEGSKNNGKFGFEIWYKDDTGHIETPLYIKYNDAEKEAINMLLALIYNKYVEQ